MPISRQVSAAGLVVFLVTAIAAAATPLWGRWRAPAPTPPAPGDTVIAYGPRTFTTTNGAATNFIERLNITPVAGTRYVLKVENGVGGPLVSVGIIRLGGNIVLSTPDLNGSGPVHREMVVTGQDTIRAIVAGAPGANMRVTVLAMADAYVTIHQKTYIQPSSAPITVTDPITRPPGVGGPFYMFVQNGNPNGTQRIAAGTAVLNNGSFGVAAFTAAIGTFVGPVNVGATGTLRVTTASSANTRVTIRITGRDTGAPILTIATPAPNTITNQAQVAVTGTVQDATPTTVTVNGVVASRNGNNYSATANLAEGSNTIAVRAVDAAGNHTDSTRTVIRDSQAPTLTITSPPDGLVTQAAQVTVSGSVTDANTVTVKVNDTPLTVAPDGTFSGQIALQSGTNFLTITATDQGGNATSGVRRVVRDNAAPSLTVATPADSAFTNQESVVVSGRAFDDNGVSVSVNGVPTPVGPDSSYSTTVDLTTEGTVEILISASDPAGNSVSTTRLVIHDTQLPNVTVTSPQDGSTTADPSVTVTGTVSDASPVRLAVNGAPTELSPSGAFSKSVDLTNGPNTITIVATDSAQNVRTVTLTVTRAAAPTQNPFTETLGIDNAVNAPPLDQTVVEPISASADFLYVGANAPQQGVPAGTIKREQAGILRGRVLNRDGTPLGGVTITVLSHPEYGFVQSRANGIYELVVNAGGPITLDFKRAGLLPSQRTFVTERQDFTVVPDVALVALDTAATTIAFVDALEVARASTVSDANGSRRVTLMFPQGTVATAIHPNGTQRTLSAVTVRATEYTVGPNGLMAMPAELPPTTAYTYAVELSADEVDLAGGEELHFSQPVPFWVENFRGFPVGTPVPMGFYDRKKGQWLAEENGRVVRVLSVSGGSATLDVVGDSTPASQAALDTLGITATELQRVAQLYVADQTLWRARVMHFSPYDGNYPRSNDRDGNGRSKRPRGGKPGQDNSKSDGCEESGSIIECENQVLGEQLAVAGTGFTLNYRTDRVPGRGRYFRLAVPLTDSVLPSLLRDIVVRVKVAGREFRQVVAPDTNLSATFVWDGLDAFGREVSGAVPYSLTVSFRFPRLYGFPANDRQIFGLVCVPSGTIMSSNGPSIPWLSCVIPDVSDREGNLEVYDQSFSGTIGAWVGAQRQGLGGWTFSDHHIYDPVHKTLYTGAGKRIDGRVVLKPDRQTISGTGDFGNTGDGSSALLATHGEASAVAVFPNGDVVFADPANHVVRRVSRNGIISTVAGTGVAGSDAPGGQGAATALNAPSGVAVGQDSMIYIADRGNHRVLRVGPDGVVALIAGVGNAGFSGDGGPASVASLDGPRRVAVSPTGILYILDSGNQRVRAVNQRGAIWTVAGGGTSDECADDGLLAPSACLGDSFDMAVGTDGSLYLALLGVVRSVDPTGVIRTIAGNGDSDCSRNVIEGPALEFNLCPKGIAVDRTGIVYIFEDSFIRKVTPNGFLITWRTCMETGPQLGSLKPALVLASASRDEALMAIARVRVGDPPEGCLGGTFGADNALYVAERPARLARFALSTPGYEATDFIIASDDGMEFYEFDVRVRHIATRSVEDGRLIYRLSYDAGGRLIEIADRFAKRVTIQRDAAGRALAILAPFGQTTTLGYDADGWLNRATYQDGAVVGMTYTTGGLLASLTDPVGAQTTFSYDTLGRFTAEAGPLGYAQSLVVTEVEGERVSTFTDAAGLTRVRTSEGDAGGSKARVTRYPGDRETTRDEDAEGRTEATLPDRTRVQFRVRGDSIFGMQVPRLQNGDIDYPDIGELSFFTRRNYVLGSLDDPRTIQSVTDTVRVEGKLVARTYDNILGRVVRRQADLTTDTISVDSLGNVLSLSAPGLARTSFTYDSLGRPKTVATAGRVSSIEYGPDGLPSASINALGFRTEYQYDAIGRATQVRRADGQILTAEYDLAGQMTRLTPAGRQPHRFFYDIRGRLDSTEGPSVAGQRMVTRMSHDAASRLTEIVRPSGTVLRYTYDSLGQLGRVEGPAIDYSFIYNERRGQLESIDSPFGDTLRFGYGGPVMSQRTWIGSVNGSVFLGYEPTMQLNNVFVQTPSGSVGVNNFFDNRGRLSGAGSLEFTYEALRGLLTRTQLDNVVTNFTFDTLAQVTRARTTRGATTLTDWQYAYDPMGRIQSVSEIVQTDVNLLAFTYDTLGQLSSATRNGVQTTQYEYDVNGNRVRETGPTGTLVATYDDQDRLVTFGSTSFTYSPNGERLSATTGAALTQYGYDAVGNLTRVELPNGSIITYQYDALGQRIARRLNGVLTQAFLYQSDLAPAVQLDAAGNVVAQFVYATHLNVPEYMERGGQTFRIISDERGSVRLVVNVATGVVAQRIDYDPLGRMTLNTSPGFQPFGYAGGLVDDDAGLVHFGARDYDPATGVWLRADPMGLGAGSTNLYAYANNDPINRIDPSGLFCIEPPGLLESFIPVWGSGRQALADFSNGDYGYAAWNTAVAITDVIPVKAAATAIGKGMWKLGSHTWSATSKWLTKTGWREFKGQEMHHWLIPQNTWGEAVPEVVKNQPWNLMPMPADKQFHRALHGNGDMNVAERLWHGTPTTAKALAASAGARGANATRERSSCGCR